MLKRSNGEWWCHWDMPMDDIEATTKIWLAASTDVDVPPTITSGETLAGAARFAAGEGRHGQKA